MNLIVIAIIVLIIVMISREPSSERKHGRRRDGPGPEARRIDELSHRIGVLEEILLDRERRLRDKFGDL